MSTLTIKNFGPIKNFHAPIARLNVLIGPQASGKSTVAKLLYYLKMFPIWLATYTATPGIDRDHFWQFQRTLRTKFLNLFGPVYHQNDISICYSFHNNASGITHTIKIVQSKSNNFKNYISIKFDDALKEEIEKFFTALEHAQHTEVKGVVDSRTVRFFHKDVTQKQFMEMANDIFAEQRAPIFIPAGRTLLTLLSGQINAAFKSSDFIMEDFLNLISDIRPRVGQGLVEVEELARRTWPQQPDRVCANLARQEIDRILRGKYVFTDGEERIYHASGHTKLSVASSGQQESLWVILLAYMLILERAGVFAVFEEPEAHLYPESQYSIVRLLALLANMNKNNQILITTHSPYILVALNNLLAASCYGEKHPEEIAKIINRKFWININEIQALAFSADGMARDIVDRELCMIKAEEIDSASAVMNEEYDKIASFE